MSDDEDDYLSDKFLLSAEPPKSVPKPTTYSEIRKVAARDSELRQEQGKRKSRHQIEKENREEALSKSLFQREEEEKALGLSSGSKALSMMMKMGFQPGQSLGAESNSRSGDVAEDEATSSSREDSATDQRPAGHSKVPLPLHEWSGKKEAGIGVRKRPASPLSHDLVAKMVKMNEDKDKTSFRDRAREQYLERQASGRLRPVQRTCVSLDEKNGQTFNVLWLDPDNHDTFPPGLMDAMLTTDASSHDAATDAHNLQPSLGNTSKSSDAEEPTAPEAPASPTTASPSREIPKAGIGMKSMEAQLKRQMQQDSLQPLKSLEDDLDAERGQETRLGPSDAQESPEVPIAFTQGQIQEAIQFLRFNVQDRLTLVLEYLRNRYAYCFWCGTQYASQEEMVSECPGETEEEHD